MTRFQLRGTTVAGFVFVAWLALILMQPTAETYRQFTDDGQWWDAQIEVKQRRAEGKPTVLYSRYAAKPMRGQWSAWVQDEVADVRVCGGGGVGNYLPSRNGIVEMTWPYFIGEDCEVPETPYRLCASWIMEDADDNREHFGPVCSPIQNKGVM